MHSDTTINRRQFFRCSAAGAILAAEQSVMAASSTWITDRPKVGIARCKRYDFEQVKQTLTHLFDMIGGVPALVRGKQVSIKVNLTSYKVPNVYTLSAIETVFTHPIVTLAASVLFESYGATRIVICESLPTRDETKTAFFNQGYDYSVYSSMLQNVEFENTRNKGTGSRYFTLPVGEEPYLFETFDFNHRYVETDVFVSIAKMKNHDIAGITLSLKNLFGIAPNSFYGGSAATNIENTTDTRGGTFHEGNVRVRTDGEILGTNNAVPFKGDPGKRVPRIVVDLNRARPIDLAIIDGITTQSGGEGSWNGKQIGLAVPNLLMAGKSAVATDAVGASAMGYNPMAEGFTKPFYNADNTLQLAADRWYGTNNLEDIDVLGLGIEEARYAILPGKDYR